LAELITKRYARRQISPRMPPEHLAALAVATDTGLFLQYLIEPGALPWELYADAMIQLLDPPSLGPVPNASSGCPVRGSLGCTWTG
jgi:hypothetical protein